MNPVCFYTSCTMMKSLPVPNELNMGSLGQMSSKNRGKEWMSRLDAYNGEKRTPIKLYAGGHWSVFRTFVESQQSSGLRSFVISAGYGLISTEISSNELLAPYAATFTSGQTDSVSTGTTSTRLIENRSWWDQLCSWYPKGLGPIRSIRQTMKAMPDSVHLLALSSSYLNAILTDLTLAKRELSNPNNLIIVSTPKKMYGDINDNIVPTSANLQTCLGGGLLSLNVRLAIAIYQEFSQSNFSPLSAREFAQNLQLNARAREIPKRNKATDMEVNSFIMKSLSAHKSQSYTPLLQSFRKSGRACEVKRFRDIFKSTIGSIDAHKTLS